MFAPGIYRARTVEGVPPTKNPMVGSFASCCARAATGHATALTECGHHRDVAIRRCAVKECDHRHRRLLRARRERPSSYTAADKCDEVPPPHGAYPKAKDHGPSIAGLGVGSGRHHSKGGPYYLLTDAGQFDILVFGPGWRGSNAIRSTTSTRVHHAPRRCGRGVAARDGRAVNSGPHRVSPASRTR